MVLEFFGRQLIVEPTNINRALLLFIFFQRKSAFPSSASFLIVEEEGKTHFCKSCRATCSSKTGEASSTPTSDPLSKHADIASKRQL